jgi:hypothetical protein
MEHVFIFIGCLIFFSVWFIFLTTRKPIYVSINIQSTYILFESYGTYHKIAMKRDQLIGLEMNGRSTIDFIFKDKITIRMERPRNADQYRDLITQIL